MICDLFFCNVHTIKKSSKHYKQVEQPCYRDIHANNYKMSLKTPYKYEDERAPLLNGSPRGLLSDRDQDEEDQRNQNRVTGSEEGSIAEELSTAKLLLILGSVWIGVFLSALGTIPALFPDVIENSAN